MRRIKSLGIFLVAALLSFAAHSQKAGDPRIAEIQRNLEAENYSSAIPLLEEIIAEGNAAENSYYWLASAYALQGDKNKAIQLLEQFRVTHKISANGYTQLINLYQSQENYGKAILLTKDGINSGIIKPSFEIYQMLAMLFTFNDENEYAAQAWERSADFTDKGEPYFQIAVIRVQQERYVEAKEAALKAITRGGLDEHHLNSAQKILTF